MDVPPTELLNVQRPMVVDAVVQINNRLSKYPNLNAATDENAISALLTLAFGVASA